MAGRDARVAAPALITSARWSRRLDTEARGRRYLITMGIRVVCFLAGCFAPSPWNWGLFISAAVLPAAAVLLVNAIDRRTPPTLTGGDHADARHRALGSGVVIAGSVEEKEKDRP